MLKLDKKLERKRTSRRLHSRIPLIRMIEGVNYSCNNCGSNRIREILLEGKTEGYFCPSCKFSHTDYERAVHETSRGF